VPAFNALADERAALAREVRSLVTASQSNCWFDAAAIETVLRTVIQP